MNGIVRASIHIYNYKQASVHKTDEVVRSCQGQTRQQSLQTNPTWTQPVKKSARVKRVASFLSLSSLHVLAHEAHVPRATHGSIPRAVGEVCIARFIPCLVIDRSYCSLRQFLVF